MSILEKTIFGDERGKLIAIEEKLDVPFPIKRVFCIFDVPYEQVRGEHAHFQTKQYIVALRGSCKVKLDNGKSAHTYLLNSPNIGVFQDHLIWGEMFEFTSDCVLMVLASELYDRMDYIFNYDEFLEAMIT
jgi:hypothetical protein